MLKGAHGWASTRHSTEGNGCSLEKYEGGDGTVNICKFRKNVSLFFPFRQSKLSLSREYGNGARKTKNVHVKNMKHSVLRKKKNLF